MPASIAYTIVDGKGEKSTMTVNIPTATTAANAITFAKALSDLVAAVIGGAIVSAGLCYEVDLTAQTWFPATADPGADVEEGARFAFVTALNNLTAFRVPTFLESLMLSGTTTVDVTDTDVDALLDEIITGNGTVAPCDTRGEDIESLSSAKEQFVKSRG